MCMHNLLENAKYFLKTVVSCANLSKQAITNSPQATPLAKLVVNIIRNKTFYN